MGEISSIRVLFVRKAKNMNYEEEQTIKKAIKTLNKPIIDSDVLSELRRLFDIRLWKEDYPSTSEYFLNIGIYKKFVFTVKINKEQYNLFDRWLHDE